MRELLAVEEFCNIPKAQLVAPSAQQNLKDNISGYLKLKSATALVEGAAALLAPAK